jgi:hypothetical protein
MTGDQTCLTQNSEVVGDGRLAQPERGLEFAPTGRTPGRGRQERDDSEANRITQSGKSFRRLHCIGRVDDTFENRGATKFHGHILTHIDPSTKINVSKVIDTKGVNMIPVDDGSGCCGGGSHCC